jgi:CheY-like chemotaxis protein
MSDAVQTLVLVADDNEAIRDTTAAILRAVGYTVIVAPDGQVALEEIAKTAFDVILLDVRMPVQDGISVVEALIGDSPPPEIMLVSAYDFDATTREHLNRRVFKYLKKPVPPRELIEAVGLAAAH